MTPQKLSELTATCWQWIFRDPIQKKLSNEPALSLLSKDRIDRFIRFIFTFIILVLLMIPIYMFSYIKAEHDTVVLIFTSIFALCVSLFTDAKRHEIFAATAA